MEILILNKFKLKNKVLESNPHVEFLDPGDDILDSMEQCSHGLIGLDSDVDFEKLLHENGELAARVSYLIATGRKVYVLCHEKPTYSSFDASNILPCLLKNMEHVTFEDFAAKNSL